MPWLSLTLSLSQLERGFRAGPFQESNRDTDDDGDCTDADGSSRYFYAQQANWNAA